MTELALTLTARRSTLHLAQRIAQVMSASDLLLLDGPLGAGKTFFVRGLARALGLPHEEPVTSPTFALIQELDTTPRLVHADMYRLNGPEQVIDLGLRAQRSSGALLVVEWGKPFLDALGGDALCIELKRDPERETHRQVRIEATGERSAQCIEALRRLLPLPFRGRSTR